MHGKKNERWMIAAFALIFHAGCGTSREGALSPRPSGSDDLSDSARAGTHPSTPASSKSTTQTTKAIDINKPRACTQDGDCSPGFCDQGFCAQILEAQAYGIECEPEPPRIPSPPPGPGQKEGPLRGWDECAAYRCMAGRCRSCRSDVDCGGDLQCASLQDAPGRRCGRHWLAESPSGKTPPTMLPLVGETSDLKPLQPGANQYELRPPTSASTPPPSPPKPSGSAKPQP